MKVFAQYEFTCQDEPQAMVLSTPTAWLERPGVRLIDIEGDWSWPLHIGLAEGDLARHALPDPLPSDRPQQAASGASEAV